VTLTDDINQVLMVLTRHIHLNIYNQMSVKYGTNFRYSSLLRTLKATKSQ